jgi:hypothetical protein
VIVTELSRRTSQVFERRQGGLGLAPDQQVRCGAIEESGCLGRDRAEGGVVAGCGQDMRQQPSPDWPSGLIDSHIAGCGRVEQPDHGRRPTTSPHDIRSLTAGAQPVWVAPLDLFASEALTGLIIDMAINSPGNVAAAMRRAVLVGHFEEPVGVGQQRADLLPDPGLDRLGV